jgi:hypothetical protein
MRSFIIFINKLPSLPKQRFLNLVPKVKRTSISSLLALIILPFNLFPDYQNQNSKDNVLLYI